SDRCLKIFKLLGEKGYPQFHLKQINYHIYKSKVGLFSQMRDISKQLRYDLISSLGNNFSSIESVDSKDGNDCKMVTFKGKDGACFETVLTRENQTSTLHLSSQVGCAFSCSYCATGKIGLKRQLVVDEIVDQVLYFLKNSELVDNLSFSGMGEPLANPHVFRALQLLSSPEYLGLSQRRFHVWTIGVLPGLKKLNEMFPQVNLGWTMNSPFMEERNHLIPINRLYPIPEVFQLLDDRLLKCRRRIWINYLLLSGINDSIEHAKALVDIIRGRSLIVRHLYHLNLLAPNALYSMMDQPEQMNEISASFFQAILRQNSISCSVRHSLGQDIGAGLGQLQAGYDQSSEGTLFRKRSCLTF
ncbi:radical SAM domain-containing protein, partial [Cardiosporidium cionae]